MRLFLSLPLLLSSFISIRVGSVSLGEKALIEVRVATDWFVDVVSVISGVNLTSPLVECWVDMNVGPLLVGRLCLLMASLI